MSDDCSNLYLSLNVIDISLKSILQHPGVRCPYASKLSKRKWNHNKRLRRKKCSKQEDGRLSLSEEELCMRGRRDKKDSSMFGICIWQASSEDGRFLMGDLSTVVRKIAIVISLFFCSILSRMWNLTATLHNPGDFPAWGKITNFGGDCQSPSLLSQSCLPSVTLPRIGNTG